MNLLELMQRFCLRKGIPSPTVVIGSTNKQIQQALAILEEEVNDLASRHTWQGLTHRAVHTTIASEDQGALETLDPGFRYVRNETVWDNTDQLPVLGPVSGPEWQAMKAWAVNGPRYRFRILGNHLLVNPVPAAGHTWSWEWSSKRAILDTNGSTLKEFFTNDADTFILPDTLHLLGLRWRWKKEKGLDYAEDFSTYEFQVKDAMGRDGGAERLFMDGEGRRAQPGIFVPQGNWTVP